MATNEQTDPRSPTCVWSLVESFLRWCESDGKKPNTIKQYRTRLKPLQVKFDRREFATLNALEIDDWLAEQSKFPDGRLKAPDTRRITAISVVQLHQYALDKKVIREKIFEKLKKPAGRKRKRLPADNEIALVLKHSSPEFALIVRASLQCGARPNELAAATFANWDRKRRMIILTEHKCDRTGDDRLIAVGDKLLPIILEAAGDRTEGPLFLSPRGKAWTSPSLTQTFTRVRKRAGLPAGLILYLMRHKFATDVANKAGLRAAQKLLGHKSIKTTEGYVHEDEADLLTNQDLVGDDLPELDDLPDSASSAQL